MVKGKVERNFGREVEIDGSQHKERKGEKWSIKRNERSLDREK